MAKTYEDWRKTIKDDASGDADYVAAKQKLDQATAAKPTYAATYDKDIVDAYNNIIKMPEFTYNLDDDALYKQYADKYMAAGKLAMKNTMGQAAALTGGDGSSYGQAVGQQAFDKYLQGLSDVALDMYDRAYGRYQDQGQRLKDAYGLAKDMGDTEYGRYMDAYGMWDKERGYAADEANAAWSRAYQMGSDAYARAASEEEQEYERRLDSAQMAASYGDFTGMAEIFGPERAAEMQKVWNSGNPDLAYRSNKITAEEYRAMTGEYPAGYVPAGGTGGSGSYYNSYYWNNVAPSGPGKSGKSDGSNDPEYQEYLAEMQKQEQKQKQRTYGGALGRHVQF